MRRRGFFAVLAGVALAPFGGKLLPKATPKLIAWDIETPGMMPMRWVSHEFERALEQHMREHARVLARQKEQDIIRMSRGELDLA